MTSLDQNPTARAHYARRDPASVTVEFAMQLGDDANNVAAYSGDFHAEPDAPVAVELNSHQSSAIVDALFAPGHRLTCSRSTVRALMPKRLAAISEGVAGLTADGIAAARAEVARRSDQNPTARAHYARRDQASVTVELAMQLGDDANRTREAALADGYTMRQLAEAGDDSHIADQRNAWRKATGGAS